MSVVLQRWARDTWQIHCTVTDGTGKAINLAGYQIGAEFWAEGQTAFSELTMGAGLATIDSATGGAFSVYVPSTMTQGMVSDNGQLPNSLPCRMVLYYIDSYGRRQTFGRLFFVVFDGTEAISINDQSSVQIVYQDAQFTIQTAIGQGPAGPSSISSSQITDAGAIGVGLIQAGSSSTGLALLKGLGGNHRRIQDQDTASTPSDFVIGYSSLTASRTTTLVAPSTLGNLHMVIVQDESGNCSPTTTITVAGATGVTINGDPNIVLASKFERAVLTHDTVNNYIYGSA